jgi:hypothetical protein
MKQLVGRLVHSAVPTPARKLTWRGIEDHSMHRHSALFLLLGVVFAVTASADEAPDVRTLMTPEEFSAAGLGKLSPAEIEALNRWVIRYTAGEARIISVQSPVVREAIRQFDATGIRTRIVGEFTGWTGETVFRLENGQVWKQRLPGRWFYRASSPEVEIKKNMMGYWMLRVVDADRGIGVTQVK